MTSALWDLEAAFVAHPVRELPDARPGVSRSVARVDDFDAGELATLLGREVGDEQDVRALTPWLLIQAVTGERVHLATALGVVAAHWADWTVPEREAVRGVVDALWRALLDEHPGEASAVAYLQAAAALGDGPGRFLEIWDYKDTASADHHLAELVVEAFGGARVDPAILAWALDPAQRHRVRRALARDQGEPWANDLAAAANLLPE